MLAEHPTSADPPRDVAICALWIWGFLAVSLSVSGYSDLALQLTTVLVTILVVRPLDC